MRSIAAAVLALALLGDPLTAQVGTAPSRNVRLTFQIVEADGFEETDPAISDIVGELRRLFRFDGYRLLDTSVLHGTACLDSAPACIERNESGGRIRQRLALDGHGTFIIEAWLSPTSEAGLTRASVYLRDGDMETMSSSGQWRAPEILNVSVNVRDGQTVILGSARDEPEAGAIILVMRAEFDPESGVRR